MFWYSDAAHSDRLLITWIKTLEFHPSVLVSILWNPAISDRSWTVALVCQASGSDLTNLVYSESLFTARSPRLSLSRPCINHFGRRHPTIVPEPRWSAWIHWTWCSTTSIPQRPLGCRQFSKQLVSCYYPPLLPRSLSPSLAWSGPSSFSDEAYWALCCRL